MLTIACVYKPGKGFTDDYVTRLRAAVTKHCKEPFRFVCLSSVDIPGVERIPLVENRDGYWNKLELFRKGLFDDQVVYLDLDTMIVSDVTDILTYRHEFTTASCFKKKNANNLASWFIAFDAFCGEDYSYLFDKYAPGTPEQYEQDWARWGDQGFIQDNLRRDWTSLDKLFPGRYASYKYEIRRPWKIPSGVSFVAFHGKPRPHEVNWELPSGD